jgi:cell shape-determining protein MreC
MHPALIVFIVITIISIVALVAYFLIKRKVYNADINGEVSLINDTLEFIDLTNTNPNNFSRSEVENFEKLTPNERKSRLEDLRKKNK